MATAAKTGFGSLWQKGDGASPEVFTTIAEITRIRFTGAEHPTIEVTNNDSPNQSSEFIKRGFTNYGKVEIEGNWISDTTQKALYGTALTGITTTNYKLTWNGVTAWGPAAAFLEKFSVEGPHDNTMTFAATYQINTKPTLP